LASELRPDPLESCPLPRAPYPQWAPTSRGREGRGAIYKGRTEWRVKGRGLPIRGTEGRKGREKGENMRIREFLSKLRSVEETLIPY